MALHLYDTYTRSLREFAPIHPPDVGVYCCGLTVYDYAHIGNLRTYIFEDLLVRTLRFVGYRARHVQNITDVGHLVSDADEGEDKMEKGARRTGKTAWEIAAFYTEAFQDDFTRLNILPPDEWPKATDHIAEQLDMIACIEANGFTYITGDGLYFDTSKLRDYGHLARLDIARLQAGARVDVGEKRQPTDFALWKFSPPGAGSQRQMEWDSPWGRGFPGWHIECSAMARKYLGLLFDIHCGGEDHIPVHHTNEIAQTEALDGAATALNRLRAACVDMGEPGTVDEAFVDKFVAQVNDDLNLPRAMAVMWELVRSDLPNATKKATLLAFDRVLGLGLAEWQPAVQDAVPDAVMALVAQRQAARAAKRWAEADALRAQIRALGYEVEDMAAGPVVRR